MLSYVPRTHVNPIEPCPVCDTPLQAPLGPPDRLAPDGERPSATPIPVPVAMSRSAAIGEGRSLGAR